MPKDIEVKVHRNDIEKALKILKKKVQNAGLFKRLKEVRYAEKPGDRKRRKRRENARRRRLMEKKSQNKR
jgi:small subunit ribosomal protein S21